ncbi:MAG TPA: trigger factor, partial [Candidatus Negativibacillus faecipullorum]|nr:trigger factor [Candidatus Negativibacillus faecipullorum]
DVNAELERMRERNSRLTNVERAAKNGDTALIDFEGFKDGVAFEGGKGENFPLNLGSGQFIPGFEEQVVGHKAGDEFELNITFPEDYHAEDLKGQPVVFKVKVNAVQEKELPALDDEFAKDVSEFDTLADLKKDVKEKLQQEADKKAQVDMENSLITTVIENMEGDIPQCMYDNKINEMVNDFSYRLQSQGMSLDLYLHYTGSDMKSFRETFQESAERQVKIRLALEKIAEVENLTATPEEIDAEYEKIAKNYGIDVSRVKGVLPEKEVIKDVTVNKAIDLVKDSAEVTEKKVKKTASKSKKKAEEAPAENAEEASADEE